MAESKAIVVLGVFVADTTYRAERPPRMGETIIGKSFALGPGGKGSNQAVAIARLGAKVSFISKLGDDAFADMALKTWAEAGVVSAVTKDSESYTGAAYIFVEEASGNNAIIVCPGAATTIGVADVEAKADLIRAAAIFITQLEQPIETARRALEIAREAGVTTILNPAPGAPLDAAMLALCDYVTPNETETEILTGIKVDSPDSAQVAADVLLEKGVGAAIITLGEAGALYRTAECCELLPAFHVAQVVETTGAGDAFNGGFATALARGFTPLDAVMFGCAVAGISVTRAGTASSMPNLGEVEAVFTA